MTVSDSFSHSSTPFVADIVPHHRDNPAAFDAAILQADLVVAVLSDDISDASVALRVLAQTSFEVEKTFVLVSSFMTWADTERVQREAALAERRAQLGDEADADEEVEDEGQQERLVVTDEMYASRVPLRRYQHWCELETRTKRSNSETLHTFVVFAGLLYGAEECALESFFLDAWAGRPLRIHPRWQGVVPTIHVGDLSRLVQRLIEADTPGTSRYIVACDRGQHTPHEILHALNTHLGTGETSPLTDEAAALFGHVDAFDIDVRATPSAVYDYLEDTEWTAPNGIVAHIAAVVREYLTTRHLTPLRCVVAGAPLVGKSTVAGGLAAHFRVAHITADDAIAAYAAKAAALGGELRARRIAAARAAARAAAATPAATAEATADADDAAPAEAPEAESVAEAEEEGEAREDDAEVTEGADPDDDEFTALKDTHAAMLAVLALCLPETPPQEDEEGNPIPPKGDVRKRFGDDALAAVMRWRLEQRDCRSRGYVVDGYPKTVRQAKGTFGIEPPVLPELSTAYDAEEEDGEIGNADEARLPATVIFLDAPRDSIQLRAGSGETLLRFLRRWGFYAKHNVEGAPPSRSLRSWWYTIAAGEGASTSPVVRIVNNSEGDLDNVMQRCIDIIGPPHYVRPTVDDLTAEHRERVEAERRQRERDEAAAVEEARRLELERIAAQKKADACRERRAAFDEEVRSAKSIASIPTEEYLLRMVTPVLCKGMAHVAALRPEDPVDALADFLYSYNPRTTL